jgi:hypothetical protein
MCLQSMMRAMVRNRTSDDAMEGLLDLPFLRPFLNLHQLLTVRHNTVQTGDIVLLMLGTHIW